MSALVTLRCDRYPELRVAGVRFRGGSARVDRGDAERLVGRHGIVIVDDTDAGPVDDAELSSLSRDELLQRAHELGVEVPKGTRTRQLVQLIEQAQADAVGRP